MSNTIKISIGLLIVVLIGIALWVLGGRLTTSPEDQAGSKPTVLANKTATTTLAIGETATINGTPIKVLSLVEDSRCPVDVQCIQAGTVRVRVAVGANGEAVLTLGEPKTFGVVDVTLDSVIPAEKNSQQTIPLGDYRFLFTVVTSIPDTKG